MLKLSRFLNKSFIAEKKKQALEPLEQQSSRTDLTQYSAPHATVKRQYCTGIS